MNKLDEHLSYIYLSEDFSSFITSIKNKTKNLFSAFRSKNFSKIKDTLKDVPKVSSANEIVALGKNKIKGFDKNYNEAKRYTKGDNSEAKKVLSTTYATLKSISENTDEPLIKSKVDRKIAAFLKFLSDIPESAIAGGVTFVIGSEILKTLIQDYKGDYEWFETLLGFGQSGGFIATALGLILVIIKYILLAYLGIKGVEVEQ